MHWPHIRGLAASAGVRLRANETEISAASWALRLGKGLYFTYLPLVVVVEKAYCALLTAQNWVLATQMSSSRTLFRKKH